MGHRNFLLVEAPEFEETNDFVKKFSFALLASLKSKKMITKTEEDHCIEELRKLYRNNPTNAEIC